MKIIKFGHACLLVEINGVKILTDPGMWNPMPEVQGLDAIVITHEHQDHCDIGQLQALIVRNPGARIITHEAVGKTLAPANIAYEPIGAGKAMDVKGVTIQSVGTEHAPIYGGVSPCRNSGYLIGGELFVPGDALHEIPPSPIRVLALPTGGPWLKISEAIDYAKKVKPEIVFPIHDAMYLEEFRSTLIPRLVGGNLQPTGILFVDLADGASREF